MFLHALMENRWVLARLLRSRSFTRDPEVQYLAPSRELSS
jgi:hypothetical protein